MKVLGEEKYLLCEKKTLFDERKNLEKYSQQLIYMHLKLLNSFLALKLSLKIPGLFSLRKHSI